MKKNILFGLCLLVVFVIFAGESYGTPQPPTAAITLKSGQTYFIYGKNITLDGNNSTADTGRSITKFEWDFDYVDPVFNELTTLTGTDPWDKSTTTSYADPNPGTSGDDTDYTVALKVYDDGTPTPLSSSLDTVTINVSEDTDGDEMPDEWERDYLGGGLGWAGSSNKDGDAYTNLCEYLHGRDPDDVNDVPDSNDVRTIVVPDEVSDLQAAIDASISGDTILLKGTYLTDVRIYLKTGVTLKGDNARLMNDGRDNIGIGGDPLVDISSISNCTVEDLIIDGNDLCVPGIRLRNSSDITIDNCTIQNFSADVNDSNGIVGIRMRATNTDCNNIQITGCTVKNLVIYLDGHTCHGITAASDEGYTFYNVDVNDCTFDNINAYNDNGEAGCISTGSYNACQKWIDPNCTEPYYFEPLYLTVQNCTFTDFTRRAIKFQSSNSTATNNDITDSDCFSGISFYGTDIDVSDNTVTLGDAKYGIAGVSANQSTVEGNIVDVSDAWNAAILLSDTDDITVTGNIITLDNDSHSRVGLTPARS